MKKFYACCLIVPLLSVFMACENDNTDKNTSNDPVFSVPEEFLKMNFGDKREIRYLTVETNQRFTATCPETWCTVNVIPEADRYNVELIATENHDAGKRTAEVTVSAKNFTPVTVTVTQLGKAPAIAVKETEVILTREDLTFSLEITSNVDVAFGLPEWIEKSGSTGDSETKIYNFVATPVPDTDFKRYGTVTVKPADQDVVETPGALDVDIPVTQYGKEPVIDLEDDYVSVIGGELDFTLKITANLEVAFELPEWIERIIPGTPAANTYYFRAGALPAGTNTRQGEITVKASDSGIGVETVTVTVKQVGDPSLETPRFAVISDIHHGRSGSKDKVTRVIKNILSVEPELDAIFVVGDVTDWGREAQYDELLDVWKDETVIPQTLPVYFMMGNHDNFGFDYDVTQCSNLFKSKLGYDNIHSYVEIKGHSFICVSEQGSGENNYYQTETDFIRQGVQTASTKFPGSPIFVFCHVGVLNTCYGTESTLPRPWGTNTYKAALAGHPEIFLFSGHSHYPVSDPRSIHQGEFTAINDGGSAYGEIEPGYSEGINPPNYNEVTEGLIVSVQTNGDVLIERWDTYRKEKISPDWLIEAPHDGSRFKYTTALRDKNAVPEFASGAKVTITDVDKRQATVNFPAAGSADPLYSKVFMYEVTLLKDGQPVDGKMFTKYSELYLNSAAPQTFTIMFDGLTPGTTYTARVVAMDSYKHRSASLVSEAFTVGGTIPNPVTDAPVADLVDIVYNTSGAYDRSTNKYSVVSGGTATPSVAFNTTTNTYHASFTGSSQCYYKFDYENDTAFKTSLAGGFTLETYYKTNGTGNHCPASSQESGGFGFESESGKMVYWIRSGSNSWVKPTAKEAFTTGTYYHLVATFGNGQTMLYINGELQDTKDITGLTLPAATSQWLAVGGDATLSERGTAQTSLNGDVVFTRMYKGVLGAGIVTKLYQQTQYRELGVNSAAELANYLTNILPGKVASNPAVADVIAEGWEVMNNYNKTEADFTIMIDKCKTY